MAIKYKVIQKTQPGVVGGGVKKYYASIAIKGVITVEDLAKKIEKFSSLSEPDIYGVIIALENVIQLELADCNIVRLKELGTLYPTISSEGRDEAEKVDAGCIKGVGVNYRPGARTLAGLKTAGFKKSV
ncbi:MAG: hypothetical protein LBC40_07370 [Dysgonamonadaceae bacterium]|jgi:predicted histone-like DNA-binding protein|nr:hypothetical protein [Dysgonamonadaceae bacterium]